jgi:preprotein translocase subunit YajC
MMHSGILPALLVLQAGGGFGSMSPFLIQVTLILAIFYFFLIRPQAQQKKKHEEALRSIRRGDQIVAFGGIVGEVVHIKETVTGEGATAARGSSAQGSRRSASRRSLVAYEDHTAGVEFVTFDGRLGEAASKEGFQVLGEPDYV